eukprot:scaffold108510_cov44-Tisochrysis_lutea.AAC.3
MVSNFHRLTQQSPLLSGKVHIWNWLFPLAQRRQHRGRVDTWATLHGLLQIGQGMKAVLTLNA